MKRTTALLTVLWTCAALAALPVPARAAFTPQATAVPGSAPEGINYQGRLEDNNSPVTGIKQMIFRVYDALVGGNLLWANPAQAVSVTMGLFNASVPVPISALVGGGARYLEVQIDGTLMAPRELLNSVPYALIAKSVEGAIDVSTAGLSIWANSSATQPSIFISSLTGNVGIGTGAPATVFDVSGNAQFGSGAARSTFTATPGNAAYALQLSSGVTIAGGGPLNLASAGSFIRFPDGTTQATAGGGGGGGWTDDGTVVRPTAPGDNVVIQSTLTVRGDAFSVGGATLAVTSGNLGVGTAGPATRLHVSGGDVQVGDATASTISALGFMTLPAITQPTNALGRFYYDSTSNKLRLSTATAAGSWVDVSTGAASGGNFVSRTGDTMIGQLTLSGSTLTVAGNAFSVGGATLVVTSGNLGIGTTAPSSKFEVFNGSVTIQGAGTGLRVAGLAGCDTIDTNAAGELTCGSDAAGGGGETNTFASSKTFTNAVGVGLIGGSGGTLIVQSTSNVAGHPIVSVRSDIGAEFFRVEQGGNVVVTANATQLLAPSGTVIAPGYAFGSAAGTGLYYTADILNLGVGGGVAMQLSNASAPPFTRTTNPIQAPNGSAAVPAYSFTNDTDTGLYRLVDNVLRFATNSTPRLVIDAGGNVGIGGAALVPATLLDVDGSASFGLGPIKSTFTAAGNLLVPGSVGIGAGAPQYRLHVSSPALATETVMLISSGTAAGQELLVVKGDGKVGIGTTGPNALFHVYSAGLGSLLMSLGENTAVATAGQAGLGFYRYTDGELYADFKTVAGGKVHFRSGAGAESGSAREWMTVDPSNGSVGIGTTGPLARVHVSTSINETAAFSFANVPTEVLKLSNASNVTGNYSLIKFSFPNNDVNALVGSVLEASGSGAAGLVFGTRSAATLGERMRITGAGNVGIGTTSPKDQLQIGNRTTFHDAGASWSLLQNNTYFDGADYRNIATGGGSSILLDPAISFRTAASGAADAVATVSERMLITNSGDVGIMTGDIYVNTQSKGLIVHETDGAGCRRIVVNNAGVIVAAVVACP